MDALLVLSTIVFVLVALSALTVAFGVDSRDGFGEDRLRATFR